VVVDEAHQLEDIASDTTGFGLTIGRFANLSRIVGAVLTDTTPASRMVAAGQAMVDALAPYRDDLLPRPLPEPVSSALTAARLAIDELLSALRAINTDVAEAKQRVLRAQKAATALAGDLDLALDLPDTSVAWAERDPALLAVAPLDVAPVLRAGVWDRTTAILTSATIPPGIVASVGLPPDQTDVIDVGSPFDHDANALLYCAAHLPDPRRPGHAAGVVEELVALVTAAGGRTLALFTSRRAMREAADAVRAQVPFPIITQDDLPKPALVERFRREESTCLFATAGLFQGIDVPGRSLSLVTIDRIPFPRPDEPLLRARRERFGADAFRRVDLPRATTLLAQASGRLIRSSSDRGVVAVLDPRLATAGYRWDVVRALPPMRRTRHRAEAEAFLRDITAAP
jgi:ATP-dependent DNA helicase DinG